MYLILIKYMGPYNNYGSVEWNEIWKRWKQRKTKCGDMLIVCYTVCYKGVEKNILKLAMYRDNK